MLPRVIAILVVRDERWVDRATAAIAAQSRRPDAVVVVDARPETGGGRLPLAEGVVVEATSRSFPGAVQQALAALPPTAEADWVWLLPGDSEPEPGALAALLAAVEVAPSVVIAGPKLVDPDDRALLRSFGESMTRFGATVPLVDDDLDQAQHDDRDDVLAVALPGALVRRAIWDRLGGTDPGLPVMDTGLDLSVRARLAGARVVRVAGARVAIRSRPHDLGRRGRLSPRATARTARRAQLHRRLVYAAPPALVVHWLALVPLAVLRSLGLLVLKRPGGIGGELAAGVAAAVDPTVPAARRRLRRARRLGWAALAPLRIPGEQERQRRATLRDRAAARRAEPDVVRASFLSGGVAVVLGAALVGLVAWWRLIGAPAVEGGALLPLSADLGTIWSRIGWGELAGTWSTGATDPFIVLLAVLGSPTAWNPSLALVLVWVLALPLAAAGAWWCATRFSRRGWPPVVAAALWALAPPLLVGLSEGRPGAVIAHLLLPWLVLAAIEGARSWSAAGGAALLFAAVTAAAPTLWPALLVVVVAWAAANPRALPRLLGIPVPALALWAPLVVAQVMAGTPLGLLADPGAVVPFPAPSGWQVLIGLPSGGPSGWEQAAVSLGLPAGLGVLVPAVLLVPLAVVALVALFLPGARRAIPATLLALAGLVTAVASSQIAVATSGSAAVGPWPGAGSSLYWLGLIGAAVVALEVLGRIALVPGLVVLLATATAVAPLLVVPIIGASTAGPGDGRVLPALVVAEAADQPDRGVLVLTPQVDGSLAVRVDRGAGQVLDATSTIVATRPEPSEDGLALAELAGNLSSRGGYDPRPGLQSFGVAFVLLAPGPVGPDADAIGERAAEALDAQESLVPIGETAYGTLWSFPGLGEVEAPAGPDPVIRSAILGAQGVVFGFVLLLALPFGRRRRAVRPQVDALADDGAFDGDDRD
jgi:GT2 family glycosyltransferase